jgi:hypothetical protein
MGDIVENQIHRLSIRSSSGLPSSPNARHTGAEELSKPTSGEDDAVEGPVVDIGVGQVMQPPPALCARCQFICNNWSSGRTDFPHCESLNVLEASAKGGCSLCAQFLASADKEPLNQQTDLRETPIDESVVYVRSGIANGNGEFIPDTQKTFWTLVLLLTGKHERTWKCSVEMTPAVDSGKCTYSCIPVPHD